MRQRLNDNPIMAVALVAVLGIAIIFLFLTRTSGSSSDSTAATTPATTPATGVATTDPTAAATATPTTPATVAPSTSPTPTGSAPFVPGPGLPKQVVHAYNSDKVVVLLIFKRNGIDDTDVRHYVDKLSAKQEDAAIFQTAAKHIADYSRIAVGVDVSQVPAIVVLEPNRGHVDKNATPKATVTYGFHGFASIQQAIRNAQYNGPDNLPTYPR